MSDLRAVELKCDVCGSPALGVACSVMGAVSHAYCRECLKAKREPWGTLVGGLMGCKRDETAQWVAPYIEATLAFYHKTHDDLWAAVAEASADYERYCAAQPGGEA